MPPTLLASRCSARARAQARNARPKRCPPITTERVLEQMRTSQLILVLEERWHRLLQPLTLARSRDDLDDLLVLERVRHHRLPVVEDHLREGLTAGVLAQEAGEAERLGDGQVGLDGVQRRARAVDLLNDGAALAVERRVDAAHRVLWALDLDEEDGLLQARRGGEDGSEEGAAR